MDDNPRNLAILQKILGGEFDFVTAASGQEALEIAPRLRPDLVLLDIMMPGMDGYETCRRLRACPQLASTKIIMVSAKAMTSERLEGYAAGADDYVVKPFDHDEMLAKVRVYVRLRSVEEVDRLKSELLSLLSHETRTPLTTILGPISLLLDRQDLNSEQRTLLTMAESGSHRLMDLIEKVSFLSQLKADAVQFQVGPEDLGLIARAALARAQVKSEQANIGLVLEAREPVPVHGDPQHLQWVIEALLDNAVRFSPPGESVEVRVWTDGLCSSLSVSDRGPGITPDLIPRVFDEFVVADIQHHRRGHGLSLATSRLIMERHGGNLTVESEAGCGATFRLELSAAAAALAAA